MVTSCECERQGSHDTLLEEANPCEGNCASASSSERLSVDRSSDQAQFIDINIVPSPQWERMTASRRLQQSFDSQDFEFSMPDLAIDLVDEAQVAPADELFYKGQLLPLQLDPRLNLVKTLSTSEKLQDKELELELHSSLRQQDASKFYSCRIDMVAGFETNLLDSRCSSFRSQNSSYWESGDKDTGDSSSSRDSNGSSQDSYLSGDKGPSRNCQGGKFWSRQGRRRSALNWKSFLGGLKKASNALGREKTKTYSSKGIAYSAELVRPKTMEDFGSWEGKPATYSQRNVRDFGLEPTRVSSGKLRWRSMDEMEDSSAGMHGDVEREKQRWHSRERWQGYARKLMIFHKLETGRGFLSMEECAKKKACEVKSSTTIATRSDRRLVKLDDLVCSSRSLLAVASCPGSILSSPNHSGLLVPSSCSSTTAPLATASTSLSALQELHSAVQGAIAHCKESMMIASTPTPTPCKDRRSFDHPSVPGCPS